MADYKIVASDLDGTLLNSSGEVSEENWQAIAEMTARGVHFVPCTGRTLHEMDPKIRDNPLVRYIIHSDGAVVYDKQTDRRIPMCMSQGVAERALDALGRYASLPAVRFERNVYMNAEQMTDEVFEEFHVSDYSRNIVFPWSNRMDRFEAFCRSMDQIEMIGSYFPSIEERDAFVEELEQTGDYLFARWEGLNYCEVFSKHAGKGNALLRLADELAIDHSETIGVGDSTNDLTLIQCAGKGLLTANGFASLREVADEVICSNDEHVMRYILEHYL